MPKFLWHMFLTSFLLLFVQGISWAVIDGHKYPFDSDTDAERFAQLAEDLRCPKCQNQNLADSDAPVAADLRDKVYQLVQEGKSDDEVVDYLVARYGDFVRYKPPFRLDTLLLWLSPVILLLLGGLLIRSLVSQQKRVSTPLSSQEQQQLSALLNSSEDADPGNSSADRK